jgi:hypothetical protein
LNQEDAPPDTWRIADDGHGTNCLWDCSGHPAAWRLVTASQALPGDLWHWISRAVPPLNQDPKETNMPTDHAATCPDCGHTHAGPHLAGICIGCPCPTTQTTQASGTHEHEWLIHTPGPDAEGACSVPVCLVCHVPDLTFVAAMIHDRCTTARLDALIDAEKTSIREQIEAIIGTSGIWEAAPSCNCGAVGNQTHSHGCPLAGARPRCGANKDTQ